MLQANNQGLLTQRPGSTFPNPLLAPPRRSRSRRSNFPEAVIACLVEGRRPSEAEIAIVAARIWEESRRADRRSWQDLRPQSRLYKAMIAAARMALGDLPLTRPVAHIPSSEPAVWWRPARPYPEHH